MKHGTHSHPISVKPAAVLGYWYLKIKLTYLYLQQIAMQQAKIKNRKIPDPITVIALCVPIPIWAPPLSSVSSCNFSPPSSILASAEVKKIDISYRIHSYVNGTYVWSILYLIKYPLAEINRFLNLDTKLLWYLFSLTKFCQMMLS